MFEKLFGRNKSIDIDQLIFDLAEHKRAKDYETFCKLLKGRAFFCQVDPPSTTGLPSGLPYQIQRRDAIKLPGLAKIKGLALLPLYTFDGDQRLKNSYVKIEGLEALRMAVKATGIDGLLFQNRHDSWIVLNREQIKQLLAQA
jgi:hypothetical protein